MRSNLYYREIADRMSERLFQNPDQITQIDERINSEYPEDSSAYSICAKAANVYGAVVAHCEDDLIDWDSALVEYADDVIDNLFEGQRIDTLDMISMAAISGQSVR